MLSIAFVLMFFVFTVSTMYTAHFLAKMAVEHFQFVVPAFFCFLAAAGTLYLSILLLKGLL